MATELSNSQVLDTRFRAALQRMAEAGRLKTYDAEADTHLEIAAIMKKLDGGPSIMFTNPKGHKTPIVGNFLSVQENCEAAFGADFKAIRGFIGRALGAPIPPQVVKTGPAQEVVLRDGFDIRSLLPVLFHTQEDAGRFMTAGIVIVRDPETGVFNASYHRLQLLGPARTGIKLDLGRHLRIAWERARARGEQLPVVVCIGTDVALHYTAATMGSQMPEGACELAAAGGLAGRPMPVLKAVTQDLLLPADTEFVLEGVIRTDEMVREGPFGEFIGFMSPENDLPVFDITAVTHRKNPVYLAVNGYGRETIMLRKYVLEASLLKAVQPAVPIVQDAEMTAGGLHRFHAVVQVKKLLPAHEGLQRNAILASFGALKDLDLVIVVDDDIDIRDPMDVEYALATRMEASRDLIVIPDARGHEYVRAGRDGIRAKLGIDATVPFEEREKFRRMRFEHTAVGLDDLSSDIAALTRIIGG